MGILDLFRGRPHEEAPQPAQSPPSMDTADYAHMRVEVTAGDGQLLFVAKLMYPRGTTAELHQYTAAALPEDSEPVPVHIRGYHDHTKKAIYMTGVISPLPKHIWKVEELSVTRVGNQPRCQRHQIPRPERRRAALQAAEHQRGRGPHLRRAAVLGGRQAPFKRAAVRGPGYFRHVLPGAAGH